MLEMLSGVAAAAHAPFIAAASPKLFDLDSFTELGVPRDLAKGFETTELVKWLIDQGVPLDQKSKSGETALDLARGSGLGITYHVQPELAEIIEKEMTKRGLTFSEHKYDKSAEKKK